VNPNNKMFLPSNFSSGCAQVKIFNASALPSRDSLQRAHFHSFTPASAPQDVLNMPRKKNTQPKNAQPSMRRQSNRINAAQAAPTIDGTEPGPDSLSAAVNTTCATRVAMAVAMAMVVAVVVMMWGLEKKIKKICFMGGWGPGVEEHVIKIIRCCSVRWGKTDVKCTSRGTFFFWTLC
jgi:hypothetical protein